MPSYPPYFVPKSLHTLSLIAFAIGHGRDSGLMCQMICDAVKLHTLASKRHLMISLQIESVENGPSADRIEPPLSKLDICSANDLPLCRRQQPTNQRVLFPAAPPHLHSPALFSPRL